MRFRPIWAVSILSISLGLLNSAWGWDKHRNLMPFILKSVSPALQQILGRSGSAPCEAEDRRNVSNLIIQLQLNSATRVPSTSSQDCGLGTQLSVMSILGGSSVDDPDQGMDQNLP